MTNDDSELLVARDGGIVTITMNRPRSLNSLSNSMIDGIAQIAREVEEDDDDRVLVLTGAGDAFAGGFMGHLARTGDLSQANLRRAMVFGSTTGSFCVERFSVQRFQEVDVAEITARARSFGDLVHFDTDGF